MGFDYFIVKQPLLQIKIYLTDSEMFRDEVMCYISTYVFFSHIVDFLPHSDLLKPRKWVNGDKMKRTVTLNKSLNIVVR